MNDDVYDDEDYDLEHKHSDDSLLSLAVFCRIIRHWTYFFFRLLNILLTLHVVFIAIRSKNSSYEFIRIGFVL